MWTGSEMIVWGGYDGGLELNTGGKYNPSTDSLDSYQHHQRARRPKAHTAVWTGNEMIVWGGSTVPAI